MTDNMTCLHYEHNGEGVYSQVALEVSDNPVYLKGSVFKNWQILKNLTIGRSVMRSALKRLGVIFSPASEHTGVMIVKIPYDFKKLLVSNSYICLTLRNKKVFFFTETDVVLKVYDEWSESTETSVGVQIVAQRKELAPRLLLYCPKNMLCIQEHGGICLPPRKLSRMLPELWRSLNEFYSLFGIKELKFGDYLSRKLESLSNQVDSLEFADPRNQRLVKLTLTKLQNILHYYRESNKRKSVFITRAHGDLQFSNILYKDGRFRLIDFERSEERQVVYDLICLQLQSRFTCSKLYKSFSLKSIDNLVKECLKWSFLGKEYGYQSEAISLAFLLDEFEYWLVDLVHYERENPRFFVWLAKLEDN